MMGFALLAVTALAQAGPSDLTTVDVAFKWFWTVIVFASIAWYAVLIFWLGTKGGIEIVRMIRVLKQHMREKEADQ
jgi:hypothetical protein